MSPEEQLTRVLASAPEVTLAVLFGSAARNEARAASDLDVGLRFEIARDSRLLVERTAHAWVDFRARAMVDWWDWASTARTLHAAEISRLREKLANGAP